MSNTKIQNATEVFTRMMGYWAKTFHISPLVLIIDPKLQTYAACVCEDRGVKFCTFAPRDIAKLSQQQLVATVFHELAHLKLKAYYDVIGEEEAEYVTEVQALKWLKKYYPKFYEPYVESVRQELKDGNYRGAYKKAFLRIPVYSR